MTRLQVDLTPKSRAALDAVMALNGEDEERAANRALQFYRLMCERQAAGAKLMLSYPGGEVGDIPQP
jgi:hypothetical protein